MSHPPSLDIRTPVSLLTGFLGSGKTTLLNAWLRDPAMSDAAVIVNEFGEIGIDHSLIASSNDNTILLSTGCLCCTVRGDLVETLRDLREKRSAGEVPNFSRVLIETTGLADPVPVIQALITFPVAQAFRLGRVISVVDAVTDALTERLRQLNPGAGLAASTEKSPPPAVLLKGIDIYDPAARPEAVNGWLKSDRYDGDYGHGGEAGEGDDPEHRGHRHDRHHDVNRHSADISSFCLTFDEPLHWEHVSAWLDALVMAHSDQLLRVKGILEIAGRPRPIVLQAVQRLFHPPTELAGWPDGNRLSRMVFITRGLSREFVLEVFETLRTRIPVRVTGTV
jgi:G3E family GTPase